MRVLVTAASKHGSTAEIAKGIGDVYGVALREFRELSLPFEEALAAIVMATVLDPLSPEVAAAIESARSILSGLLARAFLDQLDMALAGQTQGTEPQPSAARESAPAV